MSDLLRTRGLLRAERLSADRWRSQAERYARLLARDRFALARVKAERDAALAEVRERRAAEEALHSWDGLMALLDEHWPESIFPTLPDNEERDPGPRIVSLIRWVDQRRAAEGRVRAEATRWREAHESANARAQRAASIVGDLEAELSKRRAVEARLLAHCHERRRQAMDAVRSEAPMSPSSIHHGGVFDAYGEVAAALGGDQ